MKQTLLAILGFGLSLPMVAQNTITTVNNGNATNPLTWDCLCLPADGDSIIVNHDLILDVDFAITSGAIIVNASGTVTGNANNRILAIGGGAFRNYGTTTLAYMYHSSGSFINSNALTITRNFGSDILAQTVNNGTFVFGDTLLVNTFAGFSNTGSLNGPEIGTAGAFTNSGTVSCDNLANSGVLNNNSGSMSVAMTVLNIGTITNNAPLMITNDIFNAENVINNSFLSCDNLYNGDTVAQTAVFTNNGTVSVAGDFVNSRTVDGNGHFCVAMSSTNAGAFNGTFDFCDLTGGSIDLSLGTVAGGITYCSSSCTIGVNEQSSVSSVKLFPNPVSEQLTIQLPATDGCVVSIVNSVGQVVYSTTSGERQLQLSVENLATGVYSVVVNSNGQISSSRFVKE